MYGTYVQHPCTAPMYGTYVLHLWTVPMYGTYWLETMFACRVDVLFHLALDPPHNILPIGEAVRAAFRQLERRQHLLGGLGRGSFRFCRVAFLRQPAFRTVARRQVRLPIGLSIYPSGKNEQNIWVDLMGKYYIPKKKAGCGINKRPTSVDGRFDFNIL